MIRMILGGPGGAVICLGKSGFDSAGVRPTEPANGCCGSGRMTDVCGFAPPAVWARTWALQIASVATLAATNNCELRGILTYERMTVDLPEATWLGSRY